MISVIPLLTMGGPWSIAPAAAAAWPARAAARAMTTMDDALDTLINRMGRVGL